MTSMDILTPTELSCGDAFFTDSHVQWSRALAEGDTDKKLIDEEGVVVTIGLKYIKILTQYGWACLNFDVSGTINGPLGNIYDFLAVGVPVTICANRDLKNAYSWVVTSFTVHIGKKLENSYHKEHHFVYNTKNYSHSLDGSQRYAEWSQWCGNTSQEIGRFIGKEGWNLRKLLEDNKLDHTHIHFYDECDNEKMMVVCTLRENRNRVMEILKKHLSLQ